MKIHPYDPEATDDLPRFTKEQHEIIEAALNEPTKSILNGSMPGVGKTPTTAEIIHRAGWKRVLILGIKDTDKQWAEALSDQSDGAINMRIIDGSRGGRANLRALLAGEDGIFFSGMQFIVRQDWKHQDKLDPATGEPVPVIDKKTGEPTGKFERERKHLRTYKKMKRPLDAWVADEIHMIAAKRDGVGRRTLYSMPTEWRIGLSGTWHGNKVENMWSPARLFWPDLVDSSFHSWKSHYLTRTTETIYVGGKEKEVERITGEKIPGEFASTLPCYFRIEIEPPPEPKRVYVELSTAQRAQYEQMERDMLVWLRQKHPGATDEQLIPLVAEVEISKRQRLRTITLGEVSLDASEDVQFDLECRSTKINALSGLLQHYAGEKVVIVTHSKRFARVVTQRMLRAGLSVAEWSGDVKSADRAAIKQSFLTPLADGGLQYIVAVTQAFGTGLDGFQNVCSKLIQLSEVEGDAVIEEQMVNRIWRRGVDRDAFEWVKIIARDTYDEGILQALNETHTKMRLAMRV